MSKCLVFFSCSRKFLTILINALTLITSDRLLKCRTFICQMSMKNRSLLLKIFENVNIIKIKQCK